MERDALPAANTSPHHDTNIIETIQSLIVAFVLAMTFRGFVTEGFVIPTGSMAPTLLGRHLLIHSKTTGAEFPVGLDQTSPNGGLSDRLSDPTLGPQHPGSAPLPSQPRGRMGDRILVLKSLYPFSEPKRFDVVVFKNPTDPVGDAANYIKRLVGLPNEQVWLTDGDVFSKRAGESDYRIRRKPEHVQRAVWQPVHDSDFVPMRTDYLPNRYPGPPWIGDEHWDTGAGGAGGAASAGGAGDGRSYVCNTDDASMLTWDNSRRHIDDWNPYNTFASQARLIHVSDVRIAASIVPQPQGHGKGLKTTLELQTRSHVFEFIIDVTSADQPTATMRMRSADGGGEWTFNQQPIKLPDSGGEKGKPINVEFWHVDQAMHLFIDGEPAMQPLEYEWTPLERLQNTAGNEGRQDVEALIRKPPPPIQIRWRFEGSPVTLHRVRLDRDLYYRSDGMVRPSGERPFATHPTDNNMQLGPDQFMMCGDNSQMSLDSRLWGDPHPLIEQTIDEAPFLVNRKLLLGKAWVVYFPAPFTMTQNGRTPVIPDFGRLRFIR